MSTSTRPRVQAAPMNSVGGVPQVSGLSPEETVVATGAPKEVQAPARKALTSTGPRSGASSGSTRRMPSLRCGA